MLRLLGVILFDVCTAVWYRSSLTWGLMRVHKYEYLHLSARIRKCVSLDADVYAHLCFSDCAKPWHVCLSSVHPHICMFVFAPKRLLPLSYGRQQQTRRWPLTHSKKLQNSKEVHFSGSQQQFFFSIDLYSEAQIWSVVNICIECLHTVHLVLDVRLHPLYHYINH